MSEDGTARRLRIMLVFANPHQRVMPVPPYGLERISTAIADLGHEVRIEDPFLFDDGPGQDPATILGTRLREFAPDIVGISIRNIDDCLVVPDPETDEEFCTVSFIPYIAPLVEAIKRECPEAVFVAGGAAFSMMPGQTMAALDLPLGIVGAGETAFRLLVDRVAHGRPIGALPGLIRPGQDKPGPELAITFLDRPTIRDPRYAPSTFFAVRTRFGCAMKCSYCLLANYERQHANGPIPLVLKEIEEAIELGLARGLERVPIMFSDEEFNIPDEKNAIEVLRGLAKSPLLDKMFWRAYFHPTPFSDELADLVRSTHGFASITFDSASDVVLAKNGKPHRRKHLDALVARLDKRGIIPFLGFLFGLPGETEETIEETIAFIKALPEPFLVNFETGIRIYPGTPLEALAQAEPDLIVGGPLLHPLDPIIFCSPMRPSLLARRVRAEFADIHNVNPTGPAHKYGPRYEAQAYRIVRRNDDEVESDWATLLDTCANEIWPEDWYEALGAIASWYQRPSLVAVTSQRLAASGGVWQPARVPGQ